MAEVPSPRTEEEILGRPEAKEIKRVANFPNETVVRSRLPAIEIHYVYDDPSDEGVQIVRGDN